MANFPRTRLNRVQRLPKRAAYARDDVYSILDAAPICHVGFVEDGQPFVIPTIHARDGDSLLLHGSAASRMMRHAAGGLPLCVTVTVLDGLVLARSVFHNSMNYRSAVLFGRGHLVDDPAQKLAALEAISEHLLPGRWADSRQPNAQELKATHVIRKPIESASAKVRPGGPSDEPEDLALPTWAGVLPIAQAWGVPLPADGLAPGVALPGYIPVPGAPVLREP